MSINLSPQARRKLTSSPAYRLVRDNVRVTQDGPGRWHGYHDGLQVTRFGTTRQKAITNTALAVLLIRGV